MIYVYHGYVGPDHYDCSYGPIYKLTECKSSEEVCKLREEHKDCLGDDTSNEIFIIIQGTRKKLVPVESVTRWEIE